MSNNIQCGECDAKFIDEDILANHYAWAHTDNEQHQEEEVITVDPVTGGAKGQKNVQLHAIPVESLFELGKVYAFGASKYEDYNFRRGYKWSLSYDALQRHVWAFWNGEDRDPQSNFHHLAHAAWHCLSLLYYSLIGKGTDDRPQ